MAEIDVGDGATTTRRLAPGELLCSAGDTLSAVWRVTTGRLEVVVDGPSGELVVSVLESDALVGEITALAGGTASAHVRAAEPTELAEYTVEGFRSWLADNPEETERLTAQARHRANQTRSAALIAALTGIDDPVALGRIADVMTWVRLETGRVLFDQGDAADAAYLVVSGRVAATAVDETGRPTLHVEVGRGAMVGELGIIEDAPRAATVTATRDTLLGRISREDFERLAAAYPATMVRIVRSILTHNTEGGLGRSSRSIAVAVSPRLQHAAIVEPFRREVERWGVTSHLSIADVNERFPARNIASDAAGADGNPSLTTQRLTHLLHDQEIEHDYLVYEVDLTDPDWTGVAVRHADRLVVFVSDDHADEGDWADPLIDLATSVPGAAVWIVRVHHSRDRRPRRSRWTGDGRVSDVLNIAPSHPGDIERIARLATGNAVGAVFGGGGARGFAHLGAVKAMEELDIPIDVIAGTSIGAVMGGGLAVGTTPADMRAQVRSLFHNLLDYTLPVVALLKSARINANIDSFFGDLNIEDTWIPFTCLSTSLTTSEVRQHRRGRMASGVRASLAIPGVLPPVSLDGELLVDGGILDNLPVDTVALDDRVGTVVAFELTPPPNDDGRVGFDPTVSGFQALWERVRKLGDPHPMIVSTFVRSLLVAATRQRDELVASGKIDLHVVLEVEGVSLLDFETVDTTADVGYAEARPQLAAWLAHHAPAGFGGPTTGAAVVATGREDAP